ncbi:MAG: ABC transporter substrate-binding protein [Candidatus Eremiobacter antarcticus]|nr:peptide ABC transporter substrate-binding protein [Candidatus Eremiobacteraeota bacterium]MBC5808555.1 peptide ABC transporter substrate-binding protein [Candidatus Eremiobacteraeota bacterium]
MSNACGIWAFALATVCWLAAGVLGCSKIETSTGGAGGNRSTIPGVLRVGSYEDLDNLNPLLSNQSFVTDVEQMVFSGLIDYDDHGDAIPDVALEIPTLENGGIAADGKTITYHLRHGVRFSDGVALTSADVKYTWQQIMNPKNNVPYRYPYGIVASIDTPDAYTVVVHLKQPFAAFVAYFMRNGNVGSILPEHLLKGYSEINRIAFNTHPIGSGPFKVVSWQPGALLTLAANPSYWRGRPKLNEIRFQIIANQNTLLTSVLGHDVDVYYDAPEAQYATLSAIRGYRVTRVPNMTFEHIDFNCARYPLDDVRVRQAIAYAIDWKKLADHVYLGLDPPGMADIPPMSWAYDPSVLPYPHDVTRARNLLRSAGWLTGADGVVRKNGEPMRLDIATVTGVTSRAKAEQLIQQDLRAIGIGLDVHNYPASLLFATYGSNGILARGKFYLSLYAWQYTVPDPDNTQTIGPNELPPAGTNYTFWVDQELGSWQRAAQAHYGRSERRPYYVNIQRRIHDAVPMHTIVWRASIDIVSTDLKNFKPAPAVSDFWNSYEWEI